MFGSTKTSDTRQTPCLAQQKHKTPDRLVQDVSLPLTQVSSEEAVGQRGSRQCGHSGYSCPGPSSRQINQG